MKAEPRITTRTYRDGEFIIDISKNHIDNSYEAYIYHERYCLKMLMFGAPMEQQTYREFVKIVKANVDAYIWQYRREYMF